MAEAKEPENGEAQATPSKGPAPTPKKSDERKKAAPAPEEAASKAEKKKLLKPPRRPTVGPEVRRLLSVRTTLEEARPRFVRQQTYRYWRVGRRRSWRRPRGLQSKQRRHYGYRPQVVRIGYRSPAAVRSLTSTGFRAVLVSTEKELGILDRLRDAALIARTVGTRRRIVLEEVARRLGLHILNPLVREEAET